MRPLVLAAVAAAFALAAPTQTGDEIQKAVNAAHEKYKNLKEGKNADYIPALAKVVEEQGLDAIVKAIGVDAAGMRFNSIVAVGFAKQALGGPLRQLREVALRDRAAREERRGRRPHRRFAREVRYRTGLARPCIWSLEHPGSSQPGVRCCLPALLVDSPVL